MADPKEQIEQAGLIDEGGSDKLRKRLEERVLWDADERDVLHDDDAISHRVADPNPDSTAKPTGPAMAQSPSALPHGAPSSPLLEEYKLVLAKIDKIGDNRFLIKGWSATVLTGLLLGGSVAKVSSYLLLAVLPVILIFYLIEAKQKSLQRLFLKRATSLERAFQETGDAKEYVDPNPFVEPLELVPGIATLVNKHGRQATGRSKLAMKSDSLIYLLQAILVLVILTISLLAPEPVDTSRASATYNFYSAEPADTSGSQEAKRKPEQNQAPASVDMPGSQGAVQSPEENSHGPGTQKENRPE